MFKMSPRDLKRFMKRMGIEVDVKELVNVDKLILIMSDGTRLSMDAPQVTLMRMGGQEMVYAVGRLEKEEEPVREEEEVEVSEEDVQLVASQVGVSLDEAREALRATRGDLAQAIMLLEARRRKQS